MDDGDFERQRKSALALGEVNNPTALPYLALIAYQHPDETIKLVAETAGKGIYWNVNYAKMAQDGRLEQEIAKRRQIIEAGGRLTASSHKPPTQKAPQEDIDSILDRAQKKRKRRK